MAPSKKREVGIRLSVQEKEQVLSALRSIGLEGDRAFKLIQRSATPASTSLIALNRAAVTMRGTIGGFVGGMAAGIIPTLSLAAALGGAKRAMEEFGEIADRSKSAGLDPEYYQGLAHAAKLAGVEIGELSGALDTFYKNAELAERGRGKLYSQLKAINPELLKTLQLADSQEERLAAVADALEKATDKAGLAGALFGDIGPRIAAVFEGGAAEIEATIARAKELGLVVDRDLIAKADELGDQFDTATRILDLQFKQVLIELAPMLVTIAQNIAGIVRELRSMGEAIPEVISTAQIERDIAKYESMLSKDSPGFMGIGDLGFDRPGVTKRLSELQAELANRIRTQGADPSALGVAPTGFDFRGWLNGGNRKPAGGGADAPFDDEANRAAEQRSKRIADVTAKLNEQLAALGMTNREQAIQNALSQAHVTLADDEGRAIASVAGKLYDQKQALDSVNEATALFAHTLADGLDAYLDDLEITTDEVDGLTAALRRAVLQAALLGEGPLAGFAGTKAQDGGTGGILGSLLGGLTSIFTKKPAGYVPGLTGPSLLNAKGNVFARPSQLSDYANSIVRSRTPFTYAAKGMVGVMGEAGKGFGEAIMPIMRDARGRLGVAGAGAGSGPELNVNLTIERRPGSGTDNATSSRRGNDVDVRAVVYDVVAEGFSTPGSPIDRSMRTNYGARRALTGR